MLCLVIGFLCKSIAGGTFDVAMIGPIGAGINPLTYMTSAAARCYRRGEQVILKLQGF